MYVCVRVCVQLLAAGLRELKEETGLSLDPEVVCPKVLVLWEVSQRCKNMFM